MTMKLQQQGVMARLGIILVLTVMIAITGCLPADKLNSSQQQPLKVMVYSKGWYDHYFSDYIAAAFPELEIELIELQPGYGNDLTYEQLKEKLSAEKPDLLLHMNGAEELARDGLLEELSAHMLSSGMKEETLYKGMLEHNKVDGRLYALSPFFQASVLNYNKDLFAKYGIELPQDGISMLEVLELSAQFSAAGSKKDGVVGYHQTFGATPSGYMYEVMNNEGLLPYRLATGKVTVDTPAWQEVFRTLVRLFREEAILVQQIEGKWIDGVLTYGPEEIQTGDLFGQGKAAMNISGYNRSQAYPFEVGYAASPVSSSDRSSMPGIYFMSYMAIPAGAGHSDQAWDVIKFMHSDYMAKVSAAISSDTLSSVNTYPQYNDDPVVRKLYELQPLPTPAQSLIGYDPKFVENFQKLVDKEVVAAVKGEKSVDQMIAAIQQEGQALLDAAKRSTATDHP